MPEFDEYASEYKKLVHDPIRDWFGPGDAFFFARKWELLTEFMRNRGMDPAKSAWVDVGCGRGDLMRLGAKHFGATMGCDVSPEMLAACEGLDVRLQTDLKKLPFDDQSFDLATAVCVYHHVDPKARAGLTAEIARILRPGGVACIIEHNPVNPATQLIVKRVPVDRDAQLLTWNTAHRLLAAAGLTKLQTTHFLFFPESLYRRARRIEAMLTRLPLGGQYAVYASKPGRGGIR